ncbi:MAG TPA: DUF3276 family protein [Crocinitomix sp.]|nr:DUF3276 family protein [Crocinitomix sp.]
MNDRNDEVFSERVKAGKRTYFFDVKKTRGNDLYLTITESKRKYNSEDSDRPEFEKHKIFLYKEDFEKFTGGMQAALDKIKELWETGEYKKPDETEEVTFESL